MDLEYPAVSVSAPNLTGVGAFISAGKSFKFGRSVQAGVGSLVAYRSMVQMNCPDTRWILMGYSQGAMVVAQALKYFKAGELVYAGMFGDPELYLPEGRGVWPAACRGKNLSLYRVFVPNCHTDNGSLGTRNPYEIDRFRGKYGLWCNNGDFVCGSSKNLFNNGGHVEYRNGAYSQAFAIVDKILTTNRVSTNSARLMREASSEIYAYARQTEYFVAPGEEIEIDLTPSISIEHEISEYLWSFDGETWMANDAVILRSFEAGEYKILAKVSDGFNESDVLEILPVSTFEDAIRVEFFGDEIDRIVQVDILTGEIKASLNFAAIFPASHYVVPQEQIDRAVVTIFTISAPCPMHFSTMAFNASKESVPSKS